LSRRFLPASFDCTAAEQAAVMEFVGQVKKLLDERLDPKPDGYNVGFNAGVAAGDRKSAPVPILLSAPQRRLALGSVGDVTTLEHHQRSRREILPVFAVGQLS
jgi:hypothetical protein